MISSPHTTKRLTMKYARLILLVSFLFIWATWLPRLRLSSPLEASDQNRMPWNAAVGLRSGPFRMPIEGDQYSITQPLFDLDSEARIDRPLIASPQTFISAFEHHLRYSSPQFENHDETTNKMSATEHALFAYIELVKSMVSAVALIDAELSIEPRLGKRTITARRLNMTLREAGDDWTLMGSTMVGLRRLDNVRDLIKAVILNGVEGDYIETGVWRGGASIFARAVIAAYGEQASRTSYVCDSFSGLPPGDRDLDPGDKNWDNTTYLEVPYSVVANNFFSYGLLDKNVVFVKGLFRDSLGPLSNHIKRLSIMRLDGDMYESTVDVLYRLYDKLSVGGYVIIDDWFGFPARTACEDFFKVHGINPKITAIDNLAVFWMKTEEVTVQHWRYEQSKFKHDQGPH